MQVDKSKIKWTVSPSGEQEGGGSIEEPTVFFHEIGAYGHQSTIEGIPQANRSTGAGRNGPGVLANLGDRDFVPGGIHRREGFDVARVIADLVGARSPHRHPDFQILDRATGAGHLDVDAMAGDILQIDEIGRRR